MRKKLRKANKDQLTLKQVQIKIKKASRITKN